MSWLHTVSQDNKAYVRGRIIINVRERKFQGSKVPPMELSFTGTKVLGYESSMNSSTLYEFAEGSGGTTAVSSVIHCRHGSRA